MADFNDIRDEADKLDAQSMAKLNEAAASKDESRSKELEIEADRMFDAAQSKRALAQKLEDRAALSAAEFRSAKTASATKSPEDAYAEAFVSYARSGVINMNMDMRTVLQTRAQGSGSGSTGGYLLPTDFQAKLIETKKAYGPMINDAYVTVLNTQNGNTYQWPTIDDTSNMGSRLNESAAAPAANLAFGTATLGAYKYTSGQFVVPNELLNDSAIDLSAYIAKAAGVRLGRIENLDLTTGNAVSMPNGLFHAATVGVTSASNATVAADEILDFIYSVDTAYHGAPNEGIMMHAQTYKVLRKLKDSYGQYIFNKDVSGNAPATVFGVPIVFNASAPTIAAGAVIMAYGDLSAYTARQTGGTVLFRQNELLSSNDQTGFVAFERVDGTLLDLAAVKSFKMAA